VAEATYRAAVARWPTARIHLSRRHMECPDGESIVEHVAGVEDYQVALAICISR
jgi:hypothetical protein